MKNWIGSFALLLSAACGQSTSDQLLPPSSESPSDEPSSDQTLWPKPSTPEATGGSGPNPWLEPNSDQASEAGKGSPGGSGGAGTDSAGSNSAAGAGSNDSHASGGQTGEQLPSDPPAALELMLVRYEESTTSQKRLEIYNLGRAVEPTDSCAVRVYSNGNTKPYRTHALETLPAGEGIRLCTTQTTQDPLCALSLGSSSFNGNDAIVVSCGDEIQDSLGRVGEDPGKGWADGASRTWDASLVRCGREQDTDPTDEVLLSGSWAALEFDAPAAEVARACSALGLGGAHGY